MTNYLQIFGTLALVLFVGTTAYALGCEQVPANTQAVNNCSDDECFTVKYYDMSDNLIDMTCTEEGADPTDECEQGGEVAATKKKWKGNCDEEGTCNQDTSGDPDSTKNLTTEKTFLGVCKEAS